MYMSEVVSRIEKFFQRYEGNGRQTLNKLTSSPIIKLEQTLDTDIACPGSKISPRCLSLLFSKGSLGVNVYRVAEDLAGAV